VGWTPRYSRLAKGFWRSGEKIRKGTPGSEPWKGKVGEVLKRKGSCIRMPRSSAGKTEESLIAVQSGGGKEGVEHTHVVRKNGKKQEAKV